MTTKKPPATDAQIQAQLLREVLKALREQNELLRDIRDATEQAAGWPRLTG